jgi:hypothetical protein
VNPVLAIWSLGAPGSQASFNFTSSEPFALEAGGPSAEFGGTSITVSGNNVLGSEGNGIIQFVGMFDQLTWTNPTFEDYYAFTVGLAGGITPAIPEPATFLIAGLGLGLIGLLRRRMS